MKKWVELIRYVRSKLSSKTNIVYGINFTDDRDNSRSKRGGEIEKWRQVFVNKSTRWSVQAQFWKSLDVVGINMAFWDVAVDPKRRGEKDPGFTPIGKKQTENVIQYYFNR